MAQNTLFSKNSAPLAHRLRPQSLDEVVGQDHLIHSDGPLRSMIDQNHLSSHILWGPPGCGKTSIAQLLAIYFDADFHPLSAIFSGVADLKKTFKIAISNKEVGKQTLLFVDEIHRFNKAQQDAFLPYVEDGTIILVGATTENPSFELNSALLSRCQVFQLKSLDENALENLISKAETIENKKLPLTNDAKKTLKSLADGDGRYLLTLIERLFHSDFNQVLDSKKLTNFVQKKRPVYDKKQDGHYNLISALHKSMRGSDVDAALYWFSRMISAGEDPKYIARRLIRFASEDIGMADPNALQQTLLALEAYERLGSPEGELCIAQAVIYLSTAPKSNAIYTAFSSSIDAAKKYGSLMPPKIILNAPTQLMKDLDYGKGYKYDHNESDGFSGQNYFPDDMNRQEFYHPKEKGFEKIIKDRVTFWKNSRNKKANIK